MYSLSILVTVVARADARRFLGFFKEEKVNCLTMTVGRGTASGEMLDYFGLKDSEKMIIIGTIDWHDWPKLCRKLLRKMGLEAPGTGVSFVIPVSSVGGARQLQYLSGGKMQPPKEESEMKNTAYELLVAVVNQGYTDLAMEAARMAGAGGGTVVHARGGGAGTEQQFLGVSLAPEKELVFIVVKAEDKNRLMTAIMEKAGLSTRAGSVVFSLPVTGVAGIRLEGGDDMESGAPED